MTSLSQNAATPNAVQFVIENAGWLIRNLHAAERYVLLGTDRYVSKHMQDMVELALAAASANLNFCA